MSNLFEPTLGLSQFRLPPQDIALLSFCESNKPLKVKAWVEQLKLTQIKLTSAALYAALPEISHLKTDPRSRYEMLETFWPVTQQCLQGLIKDFLQQPLMLPEPAQKSALVAQALQKHLLDGYLLCAKELVHLKKLKSQQREVLLNALYRGMTSLGMLMLRSYQLYTPIPPAMWLRAHAMLQTAEYYDLQAEPAPISDSAGVRTITEAYTRIVAMGSIRPNQLAQNDLFKTFRALEKWVKLVRFFPSATEDQNNLYLVDLDQDAGPVLKSRFDSPAEHRVLELDFQALVSQLDKFGNRSGQEWLGDAPSAYLPADMPATLTEHILNCWTKPSQRNQERRRIDVVVDACIGLIDCHYQLCGGVEFDQFVNPRENLDGPSFLSGGFDALVNSLTSKKEDDSPKVAKQTVFRIAIHNMSPGGYCLFWPSEQSCNRIEAGELIGIREPDRRAWTIGVVRWVRQLRNGSHLGVQLLTTQPVPYGAAAGYDLGGYSDYMRAIHIPAPAMENQPPSLLTASAPFQENNRVKLKQEDSVIDIRLSKCVFATSKLRLFSFETLSDGNDKRL